MPTGRKKMQATLQAMTIAQRSFKAQWAKEFNNEQFRRASTVSSAPRFISTLLSQNGCEDLLNCFTRAGYDDVDFLESLEVCALLQILQEDVRLCKQDALKLCLLLARGSLKY